VRVPLSWLREFAPVDDDPEALAEILTSRGLKVEGIDRPWEGLRGVVVARVLDKRPHPRSDHLTLARLDTGSGQANIAAGVSNWEVGDLVPYAGPGSTVPALAEPLSVRTLRGEPSEGMICSPRELGLSADHGGILILDGEAPVGSDVKDLLGLDDVVFDVEIKANRPDLLSIVGVAREAAAATGTPFTLPDTSVPEAGESAADVATVDIRDPDRCPVYLARVIRGVRVGASPLPVQARLTAAGMRPVSNVVDATNYVMLEMGQPLHAFDLGRLAGPGIVVRLAADGERLMTLDGIERVLTADDLLIADLERGVGIAGVMGSAPAEVAIETRDLLLESANFERRGVIRTTRRLELHTEASGRFEKGADPEGARPAAARAAALIMRWSGGDVLRGQAHAGAVPERRHITVRPKRASMILDLPVSDSDVVEVLARIDVPARPAGSAMDVEIPGRRPDLEREIDVIEEIIRIKGYDRVGSALLPVKQAGGVPEGRAARRRARRALLRAGMRETMSYSFASARDLEGMGHCDGASVVVRSPLTAEDGYLRRSLLPGLLRALDHSRSRQVRAAALFEVGHVFERAGDLEIPVRERELVAGVFGGEAGGDLREQGRSFDVFDAKGAVENLVEGFGIEAWEVIPAREDRAVAYLHPARSAHIVIGGAPAGVLGELHPRLAAELDLGGRVALFELDSATLAGAAPRTVFTDIPRHPPVRRDLAFVIDASVPVGALAERIRGGELVGSVDLFDVFEGAPLPEGTKNVAFSVEFRADRSLTNAEVNDAVDRLAAEIRWHHGGELRTG
jgi:phenylalanyl-tRNA synthetase beta chain